MGLRAVQFTRHKQKDQLWLWILQWTCSGTFQTPERLWVFRIHQTKGELLRRALRSAVARAMGAELPAAPKKATPAHSLRALTVLGAAGPRNGEGSL